MSTAPIAQGPVDVLVGQLRVQAAEIAADGHNGWGNTMTDAADEIERLSNGIGRCYRMLLSEPDTKGALFKAENILRGLLVPNSNSTTPD